MESGETDGGQVVYIYVIMWPQDVLLGRGACLARMPLYMHVVVVVVEDRCDLNKWVVLHNGPKSLILAPQDIPDISGY